MTVELEMALRVRSSEMAVRIYFRLQPLLPEQHWETARIILEEEADRLDMGWFKKHYTPLSIDPEIGVIGDGT